MIIKKIIAFGALLVTFGSCKEKLPFQPDYEIGSGIIIGRENCSSVPSKNAWLIQLIRPSAGGRTFGDDITYNNIKYSNVIKTYNIPDTSKIAEKTYVFEFYLEPDQISLQCDIQNPKVFDILTVRINNFSGVKL